MMNHDDHKRHETRGAVINVIQENRESIICKQNTINKPWILCMHATVYYIHLNIYMYYENVIFDALRAHMFAIASYSRVTRLCCRWPILLASCQLLDKYVHGIHQI
jgi:hypothetical protein